MRGYNFSENALVGIAQLLSSVIPICVVKSAFPELSPELSSAKQKLAVIAKATSSSESNFLIILRCLIFVVPILKPASAENKTHGNLTPIFVFAKNFLQQFNPNAAKKP